MKRIACITGATSGIGEATAIRLANEGYRLIICGRRESRLEALANRLIEAGSPEVITAVFDVRDREAVEAAFGGLPEEWRSIDVLVNNAGLALGLSKIQDGEVDDWDQMIDTNVKGLLYVTRIVAPWMAKLERGHIVNIGSIAGKEVYPNGNVYCATKHAVDALTRAMRADLTEFGIRVTQIAPGAAETEFSLVRFKGDTNRAERVYDGFTPLTGPDIAEIVAFVIHLPAHVNVSDLVVTPSAQASATQIFRKQTP